MNEFPFPVTSVREKYKDNVTNPSINKKKEK